MPWDRPTLNQLYERISQDFSGRLLDGSNVLSRSVIAVFSKVIAGASNGMYAMLGWVFLQVFPDTAETIYLERWATIWGIYRKPSSIATGSAIFTGTNDAVVKAGTLLTHQASGQQYALQTDAIVKNNQVTLQLTSLSDGVESNQKAGALLSFTAPVEGVISQGSVGSEGITGGTDKESDESLRKRLLALLRQPPRGGAMHDYIAWALEVPGVTRAWCYPMAQGLGTVSLAFTCDNAPDGPLPSNEMVRRVQEYIDIQRPVTVKEFKAYAPHALPISIRISVTPNTVSVRESVEAELGDMFAREAKPDTTLLLSHFHEAISRSSGETDHSLFFPTSDIHVTQNEYPILNSIEFLGG